MAEKACHAFASTTQVGLTQALGTERGLLVTDKRFYQAAASEAHAGNIDPSLWIKVNAELPNATDAEKQACYIRLRAVELSHGNTRLRLLRLAPRAWWHWLLDLAAAFVISAIVEGIFDSFINSAFNNGAYYSFSMVPAFIGLFVFVALVALVIWSGIVRYRLERQSTLETNG